MSTANEKLVCAHLLADSLGLSLNCLIKMANQSNHLIWSPETVPPEKIAEYEKSLRTIRGVESSYPDLVKEVMALAKNKSKRTGRLRQSIAQMGILAPYYGGCFFGTLTFTDECLRRTTADTRHQYVRKYLKANFIEYRANIDFGEKNGREHYHFVALKSNNVDTIPKWQYGHSLIEPWREGTELQTSRYINKMANHATKVAPRVIYSRRSKKMWQDLVDLQDGNLPF